MIALAGGTPAIPRPSTFYHEVAVFLRGVVAVSAVLMAGFSPGAFAQTPAATPVFDVHEVEAFIDGMFESTMKSQRIPGAVFVMVKDGGVFLRKGYGYADVKSKAPVTHERTLFRIASISKLFTATAVMQLVEAGKLDLEADVNTYLTEFQIPETYTDPITLKHLLTHTAGFDEQSIGMSARTREEQEPLGEYLARRLPPRVMAPGDTISYSNHGLALAGYIVEVVSGEPFNEYVQRHICGPLGMVHTSFDLPEALAGDLATGYNYDYGDRPEVRYDYLQVAPAGSAVSCGDDMARFMIAHLNGGELGNVRVLGADAIGIMHDIQYRHDPRMSGGWAIGFGAGEKNGQRYLAHGGDLNGFASQLFLLPEHRIGLFTSCNVDNEVLRQVLLDKFMDRYFPRPETSEPPEVPSDFAKRAAMFTGYYRLNRYSRHSLEKLSTLMDQIQVTANENGTLAVQLGNEPITLVEVGPLHFKDTKYGNSYVFRADDRGRITHLLSSHSAFERLADYETEPMQFRFLGCCLIIFGVTSVGWALAFAARRAWGVPSGQPPHAKLVQFTAWLTATLNAGCLVAMGWNLMNLDRWEFTYGIPEHIERLLGIPIIASSVTLLLILFLIIALKKGYWTPWVRLHVGIVALAAIAIIPFYAYWNLLGYRW